MVETSQDDRIDANGTTGCDCGDIVASSPPSSTPARYASVYDLLPPELIDNVLSHLPRSALQHTALALTRAVPTAGVTLQHLFTAIRITRDEQAVQLVKRLGPRSPDASAAKQCATSLSCEAWRTDSNILVNLVDAFPHLRQIDLNVGPLFAPEHLEELVERERNRLERLSLRFNPYVDRASYTIFLKGLYFDTGILQLARWSVTPTFHHLSLVQDPIPSHKDLVAAAMEAGMQGPTKAHAQPIVFFKLSCLSTLATSPVAAHVKNVRLRIPNRSILTAISTSSTSSTVIPATHSATLPKLFPALQVLDISTTYVSVDAAFQGLLKRHPGLEHLVADRSGLIRFGMADETCREIGRTIASIGVSRATEAAKVYRAASRAQQARVHARAMARQQALLGSRETLEPQHAQLLQVVSQDVSRTSRRGRSSYATERRSRNNPASSADSIASLNDAFSNLSVVPTNFKPVILPSTSSLRSLGAGVGSHEGIDDELRADWAEEFQEGYEDGIAKVIMFIRERIDEYNRLYTRATNASSNHRASAEDRTFPKLLRFRTAAERRARIARAATLNISVEDLDTYDDKARRGRKAGAGGNDDEEEEEEEGQGSHRDLLSTLDLVECEVADAMALIDAVQEQSCSLCTLPDCAGEGRIAYTDAGKMDSREKAKWRRPASEHTPGCAHLVNRKIWESGAGGEQAG